jgi:pre-mRNA-splicing factor ATP-dependent RNA helicase DHX16
MPKAYNKGDEVRQDKRFVVAWERYRDVEGEVRVNNRVEQDAWEKTQVGKATLRFGAAEKTRENDDYEYVSEDPIHFIQAQTMVGDWVDEDAGSVKKARVSIAETTHERLLEDRKCLSIYRYREQLLDAIKEHQILVIEGETGSRKTTQIP